MKGAGTDHALLQKVVTERSEYDLNEIIQVFNEKYGKGSDLKAWVNKESAVSGVYKKLLFAFIDGNADEIQGEE